jgi:hypothetical protein
MAVFRSRHGVMGERARPVWRAFGRGRSGPPVVTYPAGAGEGRAAVGPGSGGRLGGTGRGRTGGAWSERDTDPWNDSEESCFTPFLP